LLSTHSLFLCKKNTPAFSVHLEQGTVTSLLEEGGTVKGVQYKTKSGEELKAYAPLTIVCDGCFSNLRRVLCSPKVHFSKYTDLLLAEFTNTIFDLTEFTNINGKYMRLG
jgi:2-polyprenyl-6-methoxyphenol hydroxylase-like FAD-dependent oxidoreductase